MHLSTLVTGLHNCRRLLGLALSLSAMLTSAALADGPANTREIGGGFYAWIDSAYEHVGLPAFTLGPGNAGSVNAVYAGQTLRLNTDASGYNVSGGIGYRLSGNWPGADTRVEIGGRYTEASSSGSGVTSYNSPDTFTHQMVNGMFTMNFLCIGTCTATTSLATNYKSGQGHVRVASDYALGSIWLTPSLALFGGESRSGQAYALVNNNGYMPTANAFYSADVHLKWRDLGVRAGLDARAPLGSWISVGLGGWLAVANRRTDLAAADSFFTVNSLGTVSPTLTTAAAAGDTRAAFLANLEGNVYFQPMRGVTLRAFGGLNFDSATPGVRAPGFTGPFNSFHAPTIAAGIGYSETTSYYAGGGLRVGF
jgi:hypothetical protein